MTDATPISIVLDRERRWRRLSQVYYLINTLFFTPVILLPCISTITASFEMNKTAAICSAFAAFFAVLYRTINLQAIIQRCRDVANRLGAAILALDGNELTMNDACRVISTEETNRPVFNFCCLPAIHYE
jgi:hypothetical protein